MTITLLLELLAIFVVVLMLYSAVALIQEKTVWAAPKEAQELIQPKPKRFKRQHLLGWMLLEDCMSLPEQIIDTPLRTPF